MNRSDFNRGRATSRTSCPRCPWWFHSDEPFVKMETWWVMGVPLTQWSRHTVYLQHQWFGWNCLVTPPCSHSLFPVRVLSCPQLKNGIKYYMCDLRPICYRLWYIGLEVKEDSTPPPLEQVVYLSGGLLTNEWVHTLTEQPLDAEVGSRADMLLSQRPITRFRQNKRQLSASGEQKEAGCQLNVRHEPGQRPDRGLSCQLAPLGPPATN